MTQAASALVNRFLLESDAYLTEDEQECLLRILAEVTREWHPPETAPLDGSWFLAISTLGAVEHIKYMPDGDYVDRFGRSNMRLRFIAWTPLIKTQLLKEK